MFLSYQQWDLIADSYIPLLAFISLLLLLKTARYLGRQKAINAFCGLFISVILVYGIMFLDNQLGIWPSFTLDYSTHSALALVLVMFIALHSTTLRYTAIASLLLYAGLMYYQQYHSVADMLTTVAVVMPLAGLLQLKACRSQPTFN